MHPLVGLKQCMHRCGLHNVDYHIHISHAHVVYNICQCLLVWDTILKLLCVCSTDVSCIQCKPYVQMSHVMLPLCTCLIYTVCTTQPADHTLRCSKADTGSEAPAALFFPISYSHFTSTLKYCTCSVISDQCRSYHTAWRLTSFDEIGQPVYCEDTFACHKTALNDFFHFISTFSDIL